MSSEEFLKKLWKNVFGAIIIFALTSTAAVFITLRITSAVQAEQIKRNTQDIEQIKTSYVPRSEVDLTNNTINNQFIKNESEHKEIRDTQREIRAGIDEIKTLLIKRY